MINLNKRFNIRITLILILWIFTIFYILFFNQYIKNIVENNILNIIENLAVESSINIENEIKNKFTILETIAYNISTEDLDNLQKTAKSFNSLVKENNLKRIAIASADGTAYYDTGEIINISDREFFKASMDGNIYVSGVLYSRVDGKAINVLSIPIYLNGKVEAVLFANIISNEFYKDFNLDSINQLGNSFIIASDGNVIVSNEKIKLHNLNLFEEFNIENFNIEKNNDSDENNGYIKLKYNTKEYVFYYSKINYSDWWVINLVDRTTIENKYYKIIESMKMINFSIIFFITITSFIISNREKRTNEKIKSLLYTDNITGGKNDAFLKKSIFKIINKKDKFAFIDLEITNIKNIVTIIGHKNTEFILKEIYTYLNNILNEDELVIHNYFGQYKLIMKYTDTNEFIERVEKIDLSKINYNIKFIMGIYLVDKQDVSYEDMCSYVSLAKETLNNKNSNNKYMIYNEKMYKKEIDKVKLEEDIKKAIENNEFKAWFQPKYGQDGKTIIGAEALVRWYKYGSVISPYIFIPMCEANGLMKDIDELIFEDVCKNVRKWIDENKKVVPISINLSRSYLGKVNLIDNLEKYIDRYKISKNLIQFEITESSLIGSEETLKDIVSTLHEKGFKVLVDDFGVGYSSIKTISYVNFDVLKIDKSFIDGIGEEKWQNIIKYTINMANTLGMEVVAEGVETEEQYKFLLECNCYMFQGYYFNKPMDSNDFSKLI